MNKEILSKIIIFASGVVTGGFITYKLLEKKFEIRTNEEIESVKSYARKKINDAQKSSEKIEKIIDDSTIEYIDHNIYNDPNQISIINDAGEVAITYEHGESSFEKMKSPFIIDMEEFQDEMSHFDKVNITFYEVDNVFCDDQDKIIDNPQNMFGDAHQYFGYLPEYPDFVYIRNYRLASDFEIQRVQASYAELILGQHGGYDAVHDEEEYEENEEEEEEEEWI